MTIRIRAIYFYITLNYVHAPIEDKDDDIKDAFYERLEEIYDRSPAHDIKIVVGDFNAKIGKEDALGSAFRLISIASARKMAVSGTRFPHKDIHKAIWISPDQYTGNEIDQVIIDRRHVPSVMDVRVIRGANIDSDHHRIAAKVCPRLHYLIAQRTLDITKLATSEVANAYAN